MKIACISDLQLFVDQPKARLDNASDAVFSKFEFVLNYCNKNKIKYLLQAGDFCDTPRNWFLASRCFDLLSQFIIPNVCAIFGQHDTYMYNEVSRHATVLGLLAEVELVTILDKTPLQLDGVDVYGCSFGAAIPKVLTKRNKNILVIHRMITPTKLFPTQERFDYAPEFLRRHTDFDLILCGDVHIKFFFEDSERKLVNTGCIIRDTADKYNFKHKPEFCIWDSETGELDWIGIPHRPAKEVLTREHIEQKNKVAKMLDFGSLSDAAGDLENQRVDLVSVLMRLIREAKASDDVRSIISQITDDEVKVVRRLKIRCQK